MTHRLDIVPIRIEHEGGVVVLSLHLSNSQRSNFSLVMAGLVIANRVYSTCEIHRCATRARPSCVAIHAFLGKPATKAWMPATSAGMTH